ncbi:MAG: FtsQ-type POTRA domain-containing protein [Actinobacteria bacterium]|nr:FtsQ-type POTRA domain-containing protein [Actinomycetota bacterium]
MTTMTRSRRGWIRKALVAVLLLVVVGGASVVWASPVLGLKTVAVDGPGAGDLAATVRGAVVLPVGLPLARIDLATVRQRVLTLGPVATATVQRQWPNTLRITVTERIAVATTEANGHWWLLDATGLPYRQLDAQPADLMPIELATPGPDDRATTAALTVLSSLPAAFRTQVQSIVAPTAYDITLRLRDGRTVIWGSASDAATKTAVLPAILERPGTVFDISDPTLVTVRGD